MKLVTTDVCVGHASLDHVVYVSAAQRAIAQSLAAVGETVEEELLARLRHTRFFCRYA